MQTNITGGSGRKNTLTEWGGSVNSKRFDPIFPGLSRTGGGQEKIYEFQTAKAPDPERAGTIFPFEPRKLGDFPLQLHDSTADGNATLKRLS